VITDHDFSVSLNLQPIFLNQGLLFCLITALFIIDFDIEYNSTFSQKIKDVNFLLFEHSGGLRDFVLRVLTSRRSSK
jgi:hypothetical protein